MDKEVRRDIHGISVNSLLKELWDIQMTQRIHNNLSFEWLEMMLVNHITEQYGIENKDSEFYMLIDRLFSEKPLWSPTLSDILKECEKEGLIKEE